MTAGVVKVPVPARCGCCNGPDPFARCDNCDEPMCGEHFVRERDGAGEEWFICTVCAEQRASDALTREQHLAVVS